MAKQVLQTQPFYLQAGIDGTQTSIVTSTITDIYGNQITSMPSGVSFLVATIEPRSPSNQESIKITAISDLGAGQVALTVVRKVQAVYPYAPLAGTVPHGNGSECIITNGGLIYEGLVAKDEPSTVTDIVTFTAPNYPRMDSVATPPTDDEQLATKKYVDDIAIAGAPDASATTKGITKLSTPPASPTDPIAVGDNDTRVPTQDENDALVGNNTDIPVGTGNKYVTQTGFQKAAEVYAVDSGGTDAYAVTLSPVPTSYAAGMTVRFNAATTNTGAATLNVNGLGAIDIRKNGTNVLSGGDIVSGQVVTVTYDGTVFQMSNAPITGVTATDIQTFTSTGANTWTKPTGAKKVLVQLWGGGGSGSAHWSIFGQTYGGGGGGGEYSERWLDASSLGATETVTVGAGGAAVNGGNPTVAGNSGGNTTFGTHLTSYGGGGGGIPDGSFVATGGNGGNKMGNIVPFWGAGVYSTINSTGENGLYSAGGGGASSAGGSNFAGGNSYYGGAGGGASGNGAGGTSTYGGDGGAGVSGGGPGVSGSVPGGGGGAVYDATATFQSGAGGNGKAIVTTFF